ncbi:MAG TPA: SRPBCC domain-containing protein [Acidimicrobiia bacterium]|nr:SRPBCC domain-containing protein [Acidimicrobiia bacterium]
MTPDTALSDRELMVSRLIEGPRDVVFEAFTEVQHLSRWWGPDGFTTTTRTFEFSEGGVWEFTMHGPDGTDYPNWIQWMEIRPPDVIVLRHGEGPDDPEQFSSTFIFEEGTDGTRVTLRSEFKTKALRDRAAEEYGAIEGANQTLDSLATYVAGRSERPNE